MQIPTKPFQVQISNKYNNLDGFTSLPFIGTVPQKKENSKTHNCDEEMEVEDSIIDRAEEEVLEAMEVAQENGEVGDENISALHANIKSKGSSEVDWRNMLVHCPHCRK